MLTDKKGFLVGALLGALSSYALKHERRVPSFREAYSLKAKDLANQVAETAKHINDVNPINQKQLIYGALSLFGAAVGLLLSLNKETTAHKVTRKTTRALHNGTHAISNTRKHAAPNKRHRTTKKH